MFVTTMMLALAGLGTPSASDGYRFPWSAERISTRPIEIKLYRDYASLQNDYALQTNARAYGAGRPIRAFAAIHDDKCVIHMVDPKIDYNPANAGHELAHCLYGLWHDEPKVAGAAHQ